MRFSSILIKLLLLVIVVGNLALASLDQEPIVEAVAEWRLDQDSMDDDSGSEPPAAAIVGFFRETITFAVVSADLPQHQHPATEVRMCACATRAPPFVVLA